MANAVWWGQRKCSMPHSFTCFIFVALVLKVDNGFSPHSFTWGRTNYMTAVLVMRDFGKLDQNEKLLFELECTIAKP